MIGVYKITNPEGKIYIGSSKNIQERWRRYRVINCTKNQPRLHESIKKYGIKNHILELECECEKEHLTIYERHYQELYNCTGEDGLNNCLVGHKGNKGIMNDDVKQRMSASSMGFKPTEAQRLRFIRDVACAPSKMKGKKFPLEWRLNMKETNYNAKIVLDTETGIYYTSGADAAIAYNTNKSTFKARLNGYRPSDKRFIYA